MTLKAWIFAIVTTLAVLVSTDCRAECRSTKGIDPEIAIDPAVIAFLEPRGLKKEDLFLAMHTTSQFETSGCWSGASNPDAQLLSVGIMQWNLGKRSLQPLLQTYLVRLGDPAFRKPYIANLMPVYGDRFFAECLAVKTAPACKDLIFVRWRDLPVNDRPKLKPDFARELDALFNDRVMRQLQMDLYARAFTAAADDMKNIFKTPTYWQQAWAVDVKTQLGKRVLTNNAIGVIDRAVARDPGAAFDSVMLSYQSMCVDPMLNKNRKDCEENQKLWPKHKDRLTTVDVARLKVLLYTRRIAETTDVIYNDEFKAMRYGSGEWKLDAFTRKAVIAVGIGYVHGTPFNDPTIQ